MEVICSLFSHVSIKLGEYSDHLFSKSIFSLFNSFLLEMHYNLVGIIVLVLFCLSICNRKLHNDGNFIILAAFASNPPLLRDNEMNFFFFFLCARFAHQGQHKMF